MNEEEDCLQPVSSQTSCNPEPSLKPKRDNTGNPVIHHDIFAGLSSIIWQCPNPEENFTEVHVFNLLGDTMA